ACSTASTSSAICCTTSTRSSHSKRAARRPHEVSHSPHLISPSSQRKLGRRSLRSSAQGHPRMKARIVTLPGDGVGPEVTAAAVAVLKTVAARYEHVFAFEEQLIGGIAIDTTGEPLPAASLAACRSADAVLLGAVGGPKWSDPNAPVRPEQGLLALRAALGVYANLRPLQVHPALADLSPLKNDKLKHVDVLFVRELTGGAYFGAKTRTADSA